MILYAFVCLYNVLKCKRFYESITGCLCKFKILYVILYDILYIRQYINMFECMSVSQRVIGLILGSFFGSFWQFFIITNIVAVALRVWINLYVSAQWLSSFNKVFNSTGLCHILLLNIHNIYKISVLCMQKKGHTKAYA